MKDDNLYPSFPVYLKGAPFLLVDYLSVGKSGKNEEGGVFL